MNFTQRLREAIRVNRHELSKLFFDLSKGILLGLIGTVVFSKQPVTVYVQVVSFASATVFIVLGMAIRYIFRSEDNSDD